LYGNQTACGQILTPHVIGVAHRTLPCGTLVRVTYGAHHVVAPVIDRGPYAQGVTWDLTSRAARVLGLAGTARVRAVVLGRASSAHQVGVPAASLGSRATGGTSAG
jgi:rare lipoprotein A